MTRPERNQDHGLSRSQSCADASRSPEDQHSDGGGGRERPILFSAPMVRAILEGRKTQTRRVVKRAPVFVVPFIGRDDQPTGEFGLCLTYDRVIDGYARCPYGQPGDRLWVREAHYLSDDGERETVVYAADPEAKRAHFEDIAHLAASYPSDQWRRHLKLRPSIHMPRWASRITLPVADVRVERLQDISEADAIAEGIWSYTMRGADGDPRLDGQLCRETLWHWLKDIEEGDGYSTAVSAYRQLWIDINGPASWDANPWVWVVSFERILPLSTEPQPQGERKP